jgi:hypothetical protein
VKRALARLVYQTGPVCFRCGKSGDRPCIGHEYGGTITGWRTRWLWRWLPGVLHGWVDPRWTIISE